MVSTLLKIAGLPAELLARADKILTQLESQGTESPAPMRETSAVTEQMSLFDAPAEHPILAELAKLDVYNMTPMQAMNVLVELKQNYKKNPTHVLNCTPKVGQKKSNFWGVLL